MSVLSGGNMTKKKAKKAKKKDPLSKIKKELDWEPRYTFETGIAETIAWYKKNQEWLAKVSNKVEEVVPVTPQTAPVTPAVS